MAVSSLDTRLTVLIVVVLLLGLVPSGIAAQDDGDDAGNECPEGLVYDPAQEMCVVPENVSDGEDPVDTGDANDEVADTGEDDPDGTDDASDEIDDSTDGTSGDDDADEMTGDDGDVEDDQADDEINSTDPETVAEFSLASYACPADVDPRDGTGDRETRCSEDGSPAFSYTVAVDSATIGTWTLETDGMQPGTIAVAGGETPIPAGTMTITMSPAEGWLPALVLCVIYDAGGTAHTDMPDIASGVVSFAAVAGDAISCAWYNVPGRQVNLDDAQGVVGNPPTQTGVIVTFTVRNCAAGTTAESNLSASCTTPGAGITFTQTNETTSIAALNTDVDGTVRFDNVQAGEWAFIETLPSGFGEPLVYCNGTFDLATQEKQMELLFGNQIRMRISNFDLTDGFVDCSWFNIPALGADDGPQIFLQVRRCERSVSGLTSVADGEARCPTALPGRAITLQLDGTVFGTETTASNGQAFFTRLPTTNGVAQAKLNLQLDGSEASAGVFCDNNHGTDTFEAIELIHTSGNGIQSFLINGETMRCSWFVAAFAAPNPNVTPGAGPGDSGEGMTVYGRLCPEGVDGSTASQELCTQNLSGYKVTVLNVSHFNVTQPFDGVMYYRMDAGTFDYYSLSREFTWDFPEIPYYSAATYVCDALRADGTTDVQSGEVVNTNVSFTIIWNPGDSILCSVYYLAPATAGGDGAAQAVVGKPVPDVESVDAGLYFYLRLCPNPLPANSSRKEVCVQPIKNARNTMTIDGQIWHGGDFSIHPQVGVDQANTTDWSVDYITGEAMITIQPIPGMGDPTYRCDIRRANGSEEGAVGTLDRNNVVLTQTWNLGDRIVCTLYFQQEGENDRTTDDDKAGNQQGLVADPAGEADTEAAAAGSNTLTIQFWTCPAGVDPAADVVALMGQCAIDATPRSITVAGTAASVTGSASWPFAEPTISATQPGGVTASSAWCSSSWVENGEEGGDFPDTIAPENGVLTVTVSHPETTVYCDWFLFGATGMAPAPVAVLRKAA
jgi:hypothetical protein